MTIYIRMNHIFSGRLLTKVLFNCQQFCIIGICSNKNLVYSYIIFLDLAISLPSWLNYCMFCCLTVLYIYFMEYISGVSICFSIKLHSSRWHYNVTEYTVLYNRHFMPLHFWVYHCSSSRCMCFWIETKLFLPVYLSVLWLYYSD